MAQQVCRESVHCLWLAVGAAQPDEVVVKVVAIAAMIEKCS